MNIIKKTYIKYYIPKFFFSNSDLNIKPLNETTYLDVKNYLISAISNIENDKLYINTVPDNNYFGDIPIYVCPTSIFTNVRPVDFDATIISTILTYYSFYNIFLPKFLLPYYSILIYLSFSKYLRSNLDRNNYILNISMQNENQVRIQLMSGEIIITKLKNINITTNFMNTLNNIDDDKLGKFNKNNIDKNLFISLILPVHVNGKTKYLVFKNANLTPGKNDINQLAYVNHELLFGILNYNVKRLSLRD